MTSTAAAQFALVSSALSLAYGTFECIRKLIKVALLRDLLTVDSGAVASCEARNRIAISVFARMRTLSANNLSRHYLPKLRVPHLTKR